VILQPASGQGISNVPTLYLRHRLVMTLPMSIMNPTEFVAEATGHQKVPGQNVDTGSLSLNALLSSTRPRSRSIPIAPLTPSESIDAHTKERPLVDPNDDYCERLALTPSRSEAECWIEHRDLKMFNRILTHMISKEKSVCNDPYLRYERKKSLLSIIRTRYFDTDREIHGEEVEELNMGDETRALRNIDSNGESWKNFPVGSISPLIADDAGTQPSPPFDPFDGSSTNKRGAKMYRHEKGDMGQLPRYLPSFSTDIFIQDSSSPMYESDRRCRCNDNDDDLIFPLELE
jgi:hypothetical protein